MTYVCIHCGNAFFQINKGKVKCNECRSILGDFTPHLKRNFEVIERDETLG